MSASKNFINTLHSQSSMTHVLIVSPNELVNKAAVELKKQKLVEPLKWSKFVKTGHHKERLPDSEDWWFYRAAAI